MKFKNLLMGLLVTGVFVGCSSPQKIILQDNTIIETKDEVEYNKKTGFYEYEDKEGKNSKLNSSEIKEIKED